MTLQDIFDQLTYGELAQVYLGGNQVGEVEPKYYKTLVNHINVGLNMLYKRFPLKEGMLVLVLQPKTYTYHLKQDFAENYLKSIEDIQYIKDTEDEPFINDIIKIERVITEKGDELFINNRADSNSIITKDFTTIKVPKELVDGIKDKPKKLTIYYKADHPRIEYKEKRFNPKTVNIELPYSFLEPLLYYVASRVHNPIGMAEEMHAGNNYYSKYEKACQRLEMLNLANDTHDQTNTRLFNKGWV